MKCQGEIKLFLLYNLLDCKGLDKWKMKNEKCKLKEPAVGGTSFKMNDEI